MKYVFQIKDKVFDLRDLLGFLVTFKIKKIPVFFALFLLVVFPIKNLYLAYNEYVSSKEMLKEAQYSYEEKRKPIQKKIELLKSVPKIRKLTPFDSLLAFKYALEKNDIQVVRLTQVPTTVKVASIKYKGIKTEIMAMPLDTISLINFLEEMEGGWRYLSSFALRNKTVLLTYEEVVEK